MSRIGRNFQKKTEICSTLPMAIKQSFGDSVFTVPPVAKNMPQPELSLEMSPGYELNLIVTLKKIISTK